MKVISIVALAGLVLAASCVPQSSRDDDAADDDATGTPEPTLPQELHGNVPDEALAAPDFVATNRDGTSRGRGDLVGQPTVLWFYPAAGTAG